MLAVTQLAPADYTLNVTRSTPEYHPFDQVQELALQKQQDGAVICHQVRTDPGGKKGADDQRKLVCHG
jgi:hypothetical protein